MKLLSLAALFVLLGILLCIGVARALAAASRRLRSARHGAALMFLAATIIATLYAQKPTPVPAAQLRWDQGLRDNGSAATNDAVFIRGTYDPIMAGDALHVDYRDRAIADSADGWTRGYDGTVSDLADGFSVTIPDATNMVVWIWSEYVVPAPTHTNGEYRILHVGKIDGGTADVSRYVAPRTPIRGMEDEGDAHHLSPPSLPPPAQSFFSTLSAENPTE